MVAQDAESEPGFGERVRTAREQAGLTLEGLSSRSGVSRAMLSNIERGTRSPTIGVASRIANGLGTRLSLLLNEGEPEGNAVLLRRGDEVFRDTETGFERHILTPVAAGRTVEIVYHRLPPGVSTGSLPPYPPGTEKYVIGYHGIVTAKVGENEYSVGDGEVLFARADRAHSFTNPSHEQDSAYYLVISHRRTA